ncbi:MAG: GntR family transcriptional regulator [Clostridia bacterium]|nr:GntR family transcriptional regulator [Clostridia bacterium]
MFSIDYHSRQPIYEQLYDNVIHLVSLGVLTPDEQLPPVRQLAMELGINPNTVSKAYKNLENDGMIYSVVGKGSFVSGKSNITACKRQEITAKITQAVQEAVKLGMKQQQIVELVDTVYKGGN